MIWSYDVEEDSRRCTQINISRCGECSSGSVTRIGYQYILHHRDSHSLGVLDICPSISAEMECTWNHFEHRSSHTPERVQVPCGTLYWITACILG